MSEGPDPSRFTTHHATLSTGVTLAYLREGVGGVPLVLVHGYPETRRIWWRNVQPLVDAGFEVIAPDLRGFGDSSLAPDGFYDVSAFSIDVHALVHEELGHERCFAAGGDAAHDAVDAGNPLKIGGKAATSTPTPVSAADRVDAYFDEYGRLVVSDRDVETGLTIGSTGLRDRLMAQRYTVMADSLADGLASFWTSSTAGGSSWVSASSKRASMVRAPSGIVRGRDPTPGFC